MGYTSPSFDLGRLLKQTSLQDVQKGRPAMDVRAKPLDF
jgi:hypothetical protein